MKIKILYEDANILVIDKPSGISVHGDGKTKEKTITDWVLKTYPKMAGVGEAMVVDVDGKSIEIDRPGVVHRLDRDTSGVLVLAKNQKTHQYLKAQFAASAEELKAGELSKNNSNKIKKVYVAVVNGWLKNDKGTINKPIGRSPSDFRRRLAGRGARGALREAVTEYKVIKRFEAPAGDFFSAAPLPEVSGGTRSPKKNHQPVAVKFTYLEVSPKTGRTHQIRVHMKYLNHPVVGDTLYNPGGPAPLGFDRLALHAKSIEFKNLKGETLKIESPLPKEFQMLQEFA